MLNYTYNMYQNVLKSIRKPFSVLHYEAIWTRALQCVRVLDKAIMTETWWSEENKLRCLQLFRASITKEFKRKLMQFKKAKNDEQLKASKICRDLIALADDHLNVE
jgi:hypothetical protein